MNTPKTVIEDVLKGWFSGGLGGPTSAKEATGEILHFLEREFVITPKPVESATIVVYFDGNGQRDSDKPGRSEVLVEAPSGAPFKTESKFIAFEKKTNNELEYGGLILALNGLIELTQLHPEFMKSAPVVIHGDSKLVIEQVLGRWRCKETHLLELRNLARNKYEELKKLVPSVELSWVPSKENKVDSHD